MIELFKQLFFARKCLCCGQILTGSSEQVFCPDCREIFEKQKSRACRVCGETQTMCGCLPSKLFGKVTWSKHLFAYEGAFAQTIIFTLKHRDYQPLQQFLAEELSACLGDVADYEITFAPRKPKSVRQYGFDQAKSLATRIAKKKDIPFVSLFVHSRRSKLQKTLDARARAENAEKSYALQRGVTRTREKLIIVDDVMTTGSTLAKLTALAKEAGYKDVAVLYVAKTVYGKESS